MILQADNKYSECVVPKWVNGRTSSTIRERGYLCVTFVCFSNIAIRFGVKNG